MSTQTLDSLCSINPEALGAATPMDMEFRYLDISAVTKGQVDWSATQLWKYANAPSRARRRLRSGDVLLCTVRPGLQAHARIRQEADAPLVGSTGFAVLRPNLSGDSGFVFHQIFGDSVATQLRALETGSSYPAVNESDVRRISVFCPEKEERWRITAVLDTVDEAIAKTEAVIAKLRQVRAGLLHDLLTRGLDQNGQLRDPIAHPEQFQDSPLGQIPREWEVKQLSSLCCHIGSGVTPRGGQDVYTSTGIMLIRSQNVTLEGLLLDDVAFVPEEIHLGMLRSEVFAHDVLFNITGASIGRCCPMPADLGTANVNQHVCILRVPKADVSTAKLLASILSSPIGQKQLEALNTMGNRQGLNYQQLGSFVIPWIEGGERQAMVTKIVDIEDQVHAEEAECEKLKLLKSGLMTDLLTGRVRVPESVMANIQV